ncbi:MAG TPA: hypothetical protein VFV67_07305 [Actinophytocola sp.]|uniref:nSTAND1 domain-containing NTPase n=1 Tax=Actinophytocola sp. TaxID=1872138 RepID=UPI002DBE5064|nr:hypothetical protein [Actinophytocola sp.]HEU5470443.1 hypothetical protein [Actinophytocola sp.]
MPRPERPLDPDAGVAQRFAAALRELRHRAGSPGYRELARVAHYSPTTLAQAARGEALPSLPVTLAYVRACGGDPEAWEARWRAASTELDAVDGPEAAGPDDEQPAPYVGLTAYGVEDADRFFGRDRLVTLLTERLSRQRFVAVVGASGSGKSSLLRAGLIPAARADRARWSTLLLTPGTHPLDECAVRLGALLRVSPGQLAAELAAQPRNLGLAARTLLADAPAEAELLLVVDQFEEVFTLCPDPAERDGFIDALLDTAAEPDNRTRVVLGLRADFFTHCARHPRLVRALQDAQVLVGPMSADELRAAVTEPAARAGFMVEKTLVTTILTEADGRQGALPLVSHALWETWRRRKGLSLRLADYAAAGGLGGAIAQSAERVYGELTPEQQRAARDIMVRLTALGEGTEDTRRRVTRTELGSDPTTRTVLDRLAAARLITVGESTVEIAHEALIAGWPTLREWLAADRDALRAHRRLTDTAAEWDRAGRDEAYLYQGVLLASWQDRDRDALNDVERAFLATSIARRDRERAGRRRAVRLTVTVLGVLLTVVSLLAGYALIQAAASAEASELAYSRQLAASARSQLQFDPELALLLATRAVDTRPTPEAQTALRQAVSDSRVRASVPTGHGRALCVGFSPDGRRLVTSGDDGTVRIWQPPQDGQAWPEPVVLHGHTNKVWSSMFSPDGRSVASGSYDGTVRVWPLDGGEPVVLRGHRGEVSEIAFAPDGRTLASAGEDGVRVWDLAGGTEPVLLTGFTGKPYSVAFSPDGRYLAASGHSDGVLQVWDRARLRDPVVVRAEPGSQGHLSFSPDGSLLVSSSTDGAVRIWDPTGQRPTVELPGHQGRSLTSAFGPDGHMVASGGQDGKVRVHGPESSANAVELHGHRGEVWSVAFSPDGRRVASVGTDGTLRLWSAMPPGEPTVLRGHDGASWAARFAGSRIVSGGADGTVRLWDTGGGEPVVLRGHTGEVLDVAASPDGRQVASAGEDGTARVWTLGVAEPVVLSRVEGLVWSVAFTPDGRSVVVSDAAGSVRRFPVAGGEPVVLSTGNGVFRQVAVGPDGRVVGAGSDGSVRIWPAAGGEPVVLRGHHGQAFSVAFSPDGRRVASGGHDGTARIWPADGSGEPIVLHGHQGLVWGIAFSQDGRYIATSGNDATLRVWSSTGDTEPVVFNGYQSSVESVVFAPGGYDLLTTHEDGTVRVQRCEACAPLPDVLALARTRATRTLTPEERETFGVR